MQITNSKSSRQTRFFFPRLDLVVVFIVGILFSRVFRLDDGIDCLGSVDKQIRKLDAEEKSSGTAVAASTASAANELVRSEGGAAKAPDFRAIAKQTKTDKIQGYINLAACDKSGGKKEGGCVHPEYEHSRCQMFGHFYDTIYNRWLEPYVTKNEPMQFLEIGYYHGDGFESYTNYFGINNPSAELHSMEISCLPEGPRAEGKWPWGNFGKKHPMYKGLMETNRLHCGDASDYGFLHHVWTTQMKRPDAPPLKVVIDDASHVAMHMAASLFFWFPRIEPGGILVVEDIQPTQQANDFRTKIMPQIQKDLHWCGGDETVKPKDSICFPQIQRLLHGVHCEMHICVFVRNSEPASEPDEAGSAVPKDAFSNQKIQKCLLGPH